MPSVAPVRWLRPLGGVTLMLSRSIGEVMLARRWLLGCLGRRPVTAGQLAVALPLFLRPALLGPPWFLYWYYGAVILALPAAVEYAVGGPIGRLRRLALSVGVGLHIYGLWFMLYPRLWWWDLLTHTVSGGFLAAGGYLLAVAVLGNHVRRRRHHAVAAFVVLAGGVAWEIWEALFVWATMAGGLKWDTAFDLVADLSGWALVAAVYPRVVGDLPRGLSRRLDAVREASGRFGGDRDERSPSR